MKIGLVVHRRGFYGDKPVNLVVGRSFVVVKRPVRLFEEKVDMTFVSKPDFLDRISSVDNFESQKATVCWE